MPTVPNTNFNVQYYHGDPYGNHILGCGVTLVRGFGAVTLESLKTLEEYGIKESKTKGMGYGYPGVLVGLCTTPASWPILAEAGWALSPEFRNPAHTAQGWASGARCKLVYKFLGSNENSNFARGLTNAKYTSINTEELVKAMYNTPMAVEAAPGPYCTHCGLRTKHRLKCPARPKAPRLELNR